MKYSDYNINEGKLHNAMDDSKKMQFIRQVFMAFQISPHQDYWQTLLKHSYPGMINFINKCNYTSDLIHLRKETTSAVTLYTNMKDLYKKYLNNNAGATNEICETLKKKGVKISDFDLTIKWFRTDAKQAITDRLKVVKEKYPRESFIPNDINFNESGSNTDVFLEYSGKEEDNREFKNVMEKFDAMFKYYVEFAKVYHDFIEFLTDTKKYKTSKEINKHMSEYSKRRTELDKTFKEMGEKMTGETGISGYDLYKKYTSLYKKFSVKYSDVTLEYKKKYAKEFSEYYDKLSKIWDYFASEEYAERVNKELERVKSIDFSLGSTFARETVLHVNHLRDTIENDLDRIKSVTAYLDPGIANSLRYKVVQALLKK